MDNTQLGDHLGINKMPIIHIRGRDLVKLSPIIGSRSLIDLVVPARRLNRVGIIEVFF